MIAFERASMSSYRLSIVTFPLSLRVSEILPLLCATFSHPTSSLPKISPCFPVSRWTVDGLWATKNEGVGLIAVQLVSKISNPCGPDPPTSQTDRRYAIVNSQYRALHYGASRGKNS